MEFYLDLIGLLAVELVSELVSPMSIFEKKNGMCTFIIQML